MKQWKDQTSDLLDIAEDAVKEAGSFLAESGSESRVVEIDSRRDAKISADKESENIVLRVLEARSDFSILTEEKGSLNRSDLAAKEAPTWIVDPLDGSVNFSRKLPLSCTSVGLWLNHEPILGVVYDFQREELFSAITGKGAWLNGERILVSDVESREDAIVCTGFPVNTEFSRGNLTEFVSHVRNYKKVRLMGSAALSLAYVACGRVDAYMEDDIMVWDVAGGLALVIGAGGWVGLSPGRKSRAYSVYASNSKIGKQKYQRGYDIVFGM